jgi:hypothetical protein
MTTTAPAMNAVMNGIALERPDRYRAGWCIDCGVIRHSAGRLRCDRCQSGFRPNR